MCVVMAFPITLGDRVFDDAPSLLQGVVQGARSVDDDPADWLAQAVQGAELDEETLVALLMALFRLKEPGALSVACRLASQGQLTAFGTVLRWVTASLDVAVLLHPDPYRPEHSMEDTVLMAWAELIDVADQEAREELLSALRLAGLVDLELKVLLRADDDDALLRWLPAVLSEPVSPDTLTTLKTVLESRHAVVAEALDHLPAVVAAPWRRALALTHA
jgi:hypothetical protein